MERVWFLPKRYYVYLAFSIYIVEYRIGAKNKYDFLSELFYLIRETSLTFLVKCSPTNNLTNYYRHELLTNTVQHNIFLVNSNQNIKFLQFEKYVFYH